MKKKIVTLPNRSKTVAVSWDKITFMITEVSMATTNKTCASSNYNYINRKQQLTIQQADQHRKRLVKIKQVTTKASR